MTDPTQEQLHSLELSEVQKHKVAELSQRQDCVEVIPKAAVIEDAAASMLFFESTKTISVACVYADGQVAWETTPNTKGWDLPPLEDR